MKLVAGPRLAQQALSIIQIESAITQAHTVEERYAQIERKKAIRHVIETGSVYEPLALRSQLEADDA